MDQKMIIIAVVVLLLLSSCGGAGYFYFTETEEESDPETFEGLVEPETEEEDSEPETEEEDSEPETEEEDSEPETEEYSKIPDKDITSKWWASGLSIDECKTACNEHETKKTGAGGAGCKGFIYSTTGSAYGAAPGTFCMFSDATDLRTNNISSNEYDLYVANDRQ